MYETFFFLHTRAFAYQGEFPKETSTTNMSPANLPAYWLYSTFTFLVTVPAEGTFFHTLIPSRCKDVTVCPKGKVGNENNTKFCKTLCCNFQSVLYSFWNLGIWTNILSMNKYFWYLTFILEQNSIHLTHTGIDRCWINKHSGLLDCTYTDLSS